jgi:hypothetical protein
LKISAIGRIKESAARTLNSQRGRKVGNSATDNEAGALYTQN